MRAEGKISADTIYDGLIKFYDVNTNRLIEESNYRRGIQEGNDIIFNKNNTIAVKTFFKDGKQDGYTYLYDKNGNLTANNYFYYGIRTGNNATYSNQLIKDYWFYSLDDVILFYINYDSVKGRKLPDLQSNYFFFHMKEYQTFDEKNSLENKTEYFLYTPNPPKFDFRYSLVLVDSAHKILSVLEEFSNTRPWSVFNLDKDLENNNRKIALRLLITDSTNSQKIGMMKYLSK